jgi:hypothetical protein
MIIKIKKAQLNQIIMIIIGLTILITIILGVTIITNNVIGINITEQNITTKAYIWNTEPNLYLVEITPSSPIDLTPGNTTQINCTGYFWDYNSWEDVAINGDVNATLYDTSGGFGHSSPDDNNSHYTKTNCTGTSNCAEIAGSGGTNGTCTCTFEIQYFANNATWECNMSIQDGGGNATERYFYFKDSLTGEANITQLLALNVDPTEIDFGNLSVTEISDEYELNLTNWGNIPINISVYGYANESNPTNLSMLCDYGEIPAGNERYSTSSGTAYTSMTPLSNESTGIPDFKLPQRTNDSGYGSDRNQTFWRLQIPLSVGGNCNGTIVFEANEAS